MAAWSQPGHNLITAWHNAWSQPDHCMITKPDHSPITAWAQPEHSLSTAWSLPEYCLNTAWSKPDHCLIMAWLQSLSTTWSQHDCKAWSQPEDSLIIAWSQSLVTTWSQPDHSCPVGLVVNWWPSKASCAHVFPNRIPWDWFFISPQIVQD
jgi:hypothetical protein